MAKKEQVNSFEGGPPCKNQFVCLIFGASTAQYEPAKRVIRSRKKKEVEIVEIAYLYSMGDFSNL